MENTSPDPQKTGSLYGIVKITEQLIQDDTWWTQHIIAQGNHIIIKINGKTVVDTVEPHEPVHEGVPGAAAAQSGQRRAVPQSDDAAACRRREMSRRLRACVIVDDLPPGRRPLPDQRKPAGCVSAAGRCPLQGERPVMIARPSASGRTSSSE